MAFLLLLFMRFCWYGNIKLHLTYNGESEICLYCYVTADIMTNILQKFSLSSPLPNVSFFSKHLNSIGCHGNQKSKFEKSSTQKP